MVTIELQPLSERILKGYRAVLRSGIPATGFDVRVEFATIRHAATWAYDFGLAGEVTFAPVTSLTEPVTVRWVVRKVLDIIENGERRHA